LRSARKTTTAAKRSASACIPVVMQLMVIRTAHAHPVAPHVRDRVAHASAAIRLQMT
jgi:hypothetical protein